MERGPLLLGALGAVAGAGLLAILDSSAVIGAANDLVAHARKVTDAATANEHDGVLLKVFAISRPSKK